MPRANSSTMQFRKVLHNCKHVETKIKTTTVTWQLSPVSPKRWRKRWRQKKKKKKGGGGGGADYEDQIFLLDRIVLLWVTQLPQTLAAECQTRTGGKVEVVEKDDRWDQGNFRARHRQTGHRSPRTTPGGTLRHCKLAAGVPQQHMGGPWIPLCTGRQLPSALCVGHQREWRYGKPRESRYRNAEG